MRSVDMTTDTYQRLIYAFIRCNNMALATKAFQSVTSKGLKIGKNFIIIFLFNIVFIYLFLF